MSASTRNRIEAIIGDRALADALVRSMTVGIRSSRVVLPTGKGTWPLFKQSLDAAIRDIDTHPRGELFRRLIEFGPKNPGSPDSSRSDGSGVLSDAECGQSVEFIFSHMVNRFKGELAELLAIEPCVELIEHMAAMARLPEGVRLYWGEVVGQRRRIGTAASGIRWGAFVKGADGLLAVTSTCGEHADLEVHGLIEVKSMRRSTRRIVAQLDRHAARLEAGVKLGDQEYPSARVSRSAGRGHDGFVRIVVAPSGWKLSRDWESVATDSGRELVVRGPDLPRHPDRTENIGAGLWKVRLGWSEEALARATYEMTFWYMSQVGGRVYAANSLPEDWSYMTAEEAGYNAIKMMLYHILLRPISTRQRRIATRLYNVYCFGYAFGADSREMLWPDDFREEHS